MKDIVVHPTLKFVYMGYIAVLAIVVAGGVFFYLYGSAQYPGWLPLTFLVLLVWPLSRHLRRLSVKLTVSTDKLRFETGILSKSTRTIQLPKVQDVRVDQSLSQRLVGVGTLSIETAGEGSRLAVHDIDAPQALADEIMRRAELAVNPGHGL